MSTIEEQNTIVKRIKKLLKLAKSDNKNEATAAAKMAAKLAQEHRISEAQLAGGEEPDIITAEDRGIIITSKELPDWLKELASILGNHFGCVMWLTKYKEGPMAGLVRMRFSGLASDVEVAKYFFDWLANKWRSYASAHEKSIRDAGHTVDSVVRPSFLEGANAGLRAALSGDMTVAIVRLNSERTKAAVDAIKRVAEQAGKPLPQDQPKFSVTDPAAFEKGYAIGKQHGKLEKVPELADNPDTKS